MFRYLESDLKDRPSGEIILLHGPFAVGKTSLATSINVKDNRRLDWNNAENREALYDRRFPTASVLVLDEIHHCRKWQEIAADARKHQGKEKKLVIAQSAKPSPAGKLLGERELAPVRLAQLHPLTTAEMGIRRQGDFDDLAILGGFPEPLLGGSQKKRERWARDWRSRVLNEVRELEQFQDLPGIEQLMLALPNCVGQPLSVNAVGKTLGVTHKTISKWLDALERYYVIFRISPLQAPGLRAVRKEQKHYHFDWAAVEGEVARFENMVAGHLLKWVHFEQNAGRRELELSYFRDIDLREVSFVISEKGLPMQLLQCTWFDENAGKGLKYLRARFPEAEAYQIAAKGKKDALSKEGIRFCSAVSYLKELV